MVPTTERTCVICGDVFWERKERVQTCSRPCGIELRGRRRREAFERDRASGKLAGRYKDAAGYYRVLVAVGDWRLEHRVVMEQKIGRPLLPHERVHHKNGRRDDNAPENLELWRIKGKDPAGVRATDYHCPGCRCLVE